MEVVRDGLIDAGTLPCGFAHKCRGDDDEPVAAHDRLALRAEHEA